MLYFRKLPRAKKFGQECGGVSRLCVENFLSHSAERFRRRGVYQGFPSKNFCLTVPKNFVQEPFSVSLFSAIEKFYALEGYVTIFCRILLSDSAEIFRRVPFSVFLISGIEKVWMRAGSSEYQDSPSKSFCLTVPKIFVGESFCAAFQKISTSEKVYG